MGVFYGNSWDFHGSPLKYGGIPWDLSKMGIQWDFHSHGEVISWGYGGKGKQACFG